MYHALQGAETYSQYVRDAESAGDEELVEFLNQACEEEGARAQRAKGLLVARLGGELDEDSDDEDETDDTDEDEAD